jgi:hypothetical protein
MKVEDINSTEVSAFDMLITRLLLHFEMKKGTMHECSRGLD